MNNNLPMIKKEGIFTKIKNWIKRLLGKEEITIEPAQELSRPQNIQETKKCSFKKDLKVKSKDVLLFLQRQLENKEIPISDLTDEELDKMIELCKIQIEEMENKIKNIKNNRKKV